MQMGTAALAEAPRHASCEIEPENITHYWRIAQPLNILQRWTRLCAGRATVEHAPFCSSCTSPPAGFFPHGTAEVHPVLGKPDRPLRRTLVHTMSGAAHGNQLLCLSHGIALAALSGRQFVVATDHADRKLFSRSKGVFLGLLRESFPNFKAIDVTGASWWLDWLQTQKREQQRRIKHRPHWTETIFSSDLVIASPVSCHKAWTKIEVIGNEALSNKSSPKALEWKALAERLSGPRAQPYCSRALPSHFHIRGPHPVERFKACALSSLFGEFNASSTPGAMALQALGETLREPTRRSAPLTVAIHIRVGDVAWNRTKKDVRTGVPPEDYPWGQFFSCARRIVHNFATAAGRQRSIRWYVASDWHNASLRKNAVRVLTKGGDAVIPPLQGPSIHSMGVLGGGMGGGPDGNWTDAQLQSYQNGVSLLLAEHIILSQADLLVEAASVRGGTPSTFSISAGMISLLPEIKVPFTAARHGQACERYGFDRTRHRVQVG